MPHIYDNIDRSLLPALRETLSLADRSDYCVGYFNLRGWKTIDNAMERFSGGEGNCCRLLVGMQPKPQEELRDALSLTKTPLEMDRETVSRKKKQWAREFKDQLALGLPTNQDEAGLRRLAAQLRSGKVVVRLFLAYPLHAKLYLHFRRDPNTPIIGFVGSSNLTFAGLSKQGELNIDVVEQDAAGKLSRWFEDRWQDPWCVDISQELIQVIDESWAREQVPPPYHIYIKMAYHLSQDARLGLDGYRLPHDFKDKLFAFQEAAVQIAAGYLEKRGGVLLGDVVGLGKTLMATALARIFEEEHGLSTLVLCPKNLGDMWKTHAEQYGLHAKILPFSQAIKELPSVPARFRLVLIDESHNLRNREGKIWQAITKYIDQSASKCILLSATPYNKTYQDLSNQLRLFIPEDEDIGIRPEALIRELTLPVFELQYQCKPRTLAAFEKSRHADDWRDLMKRYLVRRTRGFIQDNYAFAECAACQAAVPALVAGCPDCGRKKKPSDRRFLIYPQTGKKSYFP